MDRFYLQPNIVNMITVVIMATVGVAIIAWVASMLRANFAPNASA